MLKRQVGFSPGDIATLENRHVGEAVFLECLGGDGCHKAEGTGGSAKHLVGGEMVAQQLLSGEAAAE